jgi:sec-independent protein translocase protein TatB
MFDIGFSEMLVCAVVALVVIGPEKLPRVARTLGHLFGRLQRYVTQVKSDIHREMELAEIGKVKTEFEDAARSFKSEIDSKAAETEREFRELQTSIEAEATPTPAPLVEEPPAEALPSDAAPSPQLELGIDAPPVADPQRKQAAG